MPNQAKDMEEMLFFSQMLNECSPLELLKQVLMHSHHAIVITDADASAGYRIIYANPVFCRHTGYELAELVGMSPRILQGPKSNKRIIEKLTPALKEHGFFYGASINYRKDGSMYPVEWNISEIKNEQGEVTHYMSMQKDLSNFHRLAKQVKKSNENFKDFYLSTTKKDKAHANKEVLDALKDNQKIYAGGLRNDENADLFEDAFFDFSPDEMGALGNKVDKGELSAEEFWRENPIDDEDVSALIESIQEVDVELGLLQSQGQSKERLENIANGFKEVANNLYFCVEFNDGALIIDEVANILMILEESHEFPVDVLVTFNKEVYEWLDGAVITKNADNIFEGENNTIAAGNQLLLFLK
ncbi:PAS domain S-box protein [Pseudoalteromonas luteoviolacea]|uniref:PAS domain-containing protein n=1 Tax=Pseudoalteromonas luteoviolacea TaxID=43657 RepID=UPI001B3A0076|nr:PAS domain S-box protein [Pseudoalteromonas luteoviolacea]MBQ4876670.1 PAS domain S-box protein [Pseudoalteromonas luteoviolacea]MBQ4905541.1 PAS domain S-box protein [Pseudoalteromonas luteoviolacea]